MSIAIIGLGQIGSSFGAALVSRRLDARVIGIARRRDAARRALAMRAAHETTTDLAAAHEADVVVLATPVRSIIALLPHVAHLLKPGAIADYIITGAWAEKALKEAQRVGTTHVAGSTQSENEIVYAFPGIVSSVWARKPSDPIGPSCAPKVPLWT